MPCSPVSTDAMLLVMAEEDAFFRALSERLQQAGYQFLCRSSVDAQTWLERQTPLLVVFCLPEGEAGPALVAQWRQRTDRPLLAIEATGTVAGRIAALSRGADDVLSAPADAEECLWRIQALLRRYPRGPDHPARMLRADSLCLDRQLMRVEVDQTAVALTPIQFRLLWTLVSHRERVLDKPFLYRQVLEKPFSTDDRSLDMHLSRVRRKLIQAGLAPERLKTIHGQGYGFR